LIGSICVVLILTQGRGCLVLRIVALLWVALCFAGASAVAMGSETRTYLHTDHLGSVVAGTDESGNVLWREEYEPYGLKRLRPNNTQGQRLWFAGHAHDDALSLSYFGARWYDPDVGRFLAVDPRDWTENSPMHSFNRYAYANNNPYRFVDPDGEFPFVFLAFAAVDFYLNYQDSGSVSEAAGVTMLGMVNPGKKLGITAKVGKRVAGATKRIPSVDELSRAAAQPRKGGFTEAGGSLQKHGSRPGSKWNQPDINVNKPSQANPRGQDLVDDVLTAPGGKVSPNPRGGWDATAPDGRTVRFNRDGTMQGFRE